MARFRTTAIISLAAVTLLALAHLLPPPVSAASPRNILVLHSYHPGLRWTDDIMAGIENTFEGSTLDFRLHTEYLDTKRTPSPDYLSRYAPVLAYKLTLHDFDLVLVSDNDALNFVLGHRSDLFAGLPMVFCGVNDFQPQWIAADPLISGVAEEPGFRETMELALRLHPETREMIIIGSERGASGRSIHRQISAAALALPERVAVTYWSDFPVAELKRRIADLEPGQLLFLSSTVSDDAGSFYSETESLSLLRQGCRVPIYGFWDFFLGEGIVGGHLVSGFTQGQLAAGLALRILAGEEPEALPVIRGEGNRPLFDYRELLRFAVDFRALPKESTFINEPASVYPVRSEELWAVSAVMTALTAFTLLLLWSRRRRRDAEQALRISEERLRLAHEGSRDALWDWDAVTGRNLVDERWCSMLGYRKDEIEENMDQWQALVHPEDLPQITRNHRECMEGRIAHFTGEFRMRTKGGSWKWILGSGKVVARDGSGRPLRLTGTHKDISRQKEAELALKEALAEAQSGREKIDAILSSIGDGLMVTDPDGRVTLVNVAALFLLGIEEEEILGRPIDSIIPEPAFALGLNRAHSREGEAIPVDLERFDEGHQEVRHILARFAAIHSREGSTSGVITLLQDVTRDREKERLKSEFISTAAHELNTPLTVILGFAELLQDLPHFSEEEQREYLGIIADKTESLARIVEDLLDLSRIESGRLITLNRVNASIESLILPLLDHYRRAYPRHRFAAKFPASAITLSLDRGKIGQVLENILSNAVKYSPDGGTVTISGELDGANLRIAVADEGIGMTQEELARIFDKFYRAPGRGVVSGLGLGMAIARNIIEAHGGEITVVSAFGQGTTVSFSLPLQPGEEAP